MFVPTNYNKCTSYMDYRPKQHISRNTIYGNNNNNNDNSNNHKNCQGYSNRQTNSHVSNSSQGFNNNLGNLSNNTEQHQPNQQRLRASDWHSGMSPHRYEVCITPNSIKKCYGCNQEFAATYRCHSQNVIICHVDQRIQVITNDGSIFHGVDFARTAYYHCKLSHIAQKNPSFDSVVHLNYRLPLTNEQQYVLMTSGLTVKYD